MRQELHRPEGGRVQWHIIDQYIAKQEAQSRFPAFMFLASTTLSYCMQLQNLTWAARIFDVPPDVIYPPVTTRRDFQSSLLIARNKDAKSILLISAPECPDYCNKT